MRYLGQNLFREALEQGSLTPFNKAENAMVHSDSLRAQADIHKAIRFGLAGIAVYGWGMEITEPLPDGEGFSMGGGSGAYQFTEAIPPHDPSIIDRSIAGWDRYTTVTQGEFALETLKQALEKSSGDYFLRSDAEVEGIPLTQVYQELRYQFILAGRLGVYQVPDTYRTWKPVNHDIYESRKNSGRGVNPAYAIGRTTQNTIRFTEGPIKAIMQHAFNRYESGKRQVPEENIFSDEVIADHDHTIQHIVDVMRHAVHASQRADGTYVVAAEDTQITMNPDGIPVWNYKDYPPTNFLAPDRLHPVDNRLTMVTARNKCPFNYSTNAFETTPMHRVMSATLNYLAKGDLLDPRNFMAPKEIISFVNPHRY